MFEDVAHLRPIEAERDFAVRLRHPSPEYVLIQQGEESVKVAGVKRSAQWVTSHLRIISPSVARSTFDCPAPAPSALGRSQARPLPIHQPAPATPAVLPCRNETQRSLRTSSGSWKAAPRAILPAVKVPARWRPSVKRDLRSRPGPGQHCPPARCRKAATFRVHDGRVGQWPALLERRGSDRVGHLAIPDDRGVITLHDGGSHGCRNHEVLHPLGRFQWAQVEEL